MKNRSLDMTEGSALKLLTLFTFPTLAGNLLNQVYSITDSIIVGQYLGQTSLAAIGVCMPIILLTASMVIGTNVGVGILTSQCFGRHDMAGMRHTLANAFYLAVIISLLTALIGIPVIRPVLRLMNTPEGPLADAAAYMTVNLAATICPMMYYLLSNAFRGMGDSVTALFCLVVSVIANIFLDILFVAVLHLGVAGTAWATALAQTASVVFSFIMLYRKYPEMHFKKEDFGFDSPMLKQIAGIAIPVAVQNSFNNLGNIVVQGCINGFGEAVMAAYTAASRLGTISLMPVETVGSSMSVYAGQNYGAKKNERIPSGVRAAWQLCLIISLILGLVLVFFGGSFTRLFLKNPSLEITDTAYRYLLFAAVPGIFCGIMSIYQQTIRGMGHSNESVIGGFMQLGAKVAVVLLGAAVLQNLDVVWLAWPLSFIAGTVYPYMVYRRLFRKSPTIS